MTYALADTIPPLSIDLGCRLRSRAAEAALSRREGFTLVELLVVISIIGILAALSVPAINGALLKARSTESQANLRQIGAALLLHAQDNEGLFPTAHSTSDFIGNPAADQVLPWAQQLDAYTGKSRKLFFSSYAKFWNPTAEKWGYFLGSHAAGVEALAKGMDKFQPVNLTKIRQPMRHILAGECHRSKQVDDADMDDYDQNNPGFGYSGKPRKVNILFADGHVEAPSRFDSATMAVTYEGIPDLSGTSYE